MDCGDARESFVVWKSRCQGEVRKRDILLARVHSLTARSIWVPPTKKAKSENTPAPVNEREVSKSEDEMQKDAAKVVENGSSNSPRPELGAVKKMKTFFENLNKNK